MSTTLKAALNGIAADERAKVLKHTHALYGQFKPQWEILLDAMDGCGGFLNGDYLWKFPREVQTKFDERKAQARYHNYVESLVEIYVRHVFGRGVKRKTTSETLNAFWDNVDGHRTKLTDYLKTQTAIALATGHVGVLMDKPATEAPGPSREDEKTVGIVPYLSTFSPVAILDWRTEHDEVVAVKLSEADQSDDLLAPDKDSENQSYLFWNRDGWLRTDGNGEATTNADLTLGMVPFHVLRPKRSRRYPFIGKPLVNASLVTALYNRGSEEDDVLRNQAFSVFTISLPKDTTADEVEKAKQALGGDIGTTQALFVVGEGDYKTPDMNVPKTIRENQQWLIQEIYRMAHLRFNRDSLEAETAEAIRLQHAELNEMLVGLAGELTELELQLARFFFHWTEPTPEAAERAFEAAGVAVEYPKEFFLRELAAELRDWAEAIRMRLGEKFSKHLKKLAIHRIAPDLDDATRKEFEDEIDALKDEAPSSELLRAGAVARMTGFGKKPEPEPEPEPKPGDKKAAA